MKEPSSKAMRLLKTFLKISVSLGGLAYIFSKIPLQDVSKHWSMEALPWIGVVLVTTFLSMCVQANRWKGLLLENAKGIKFRTFYAYIALGYFFNNLLPSGFGGDAVKTIAFGKRFGNMANSVAAIVISRIMGLLAMFLCFFIALPFVASRYEIPSAYTVTVCIFALASIIIIVGGLFLDKIKLPLKVTSRYPFLGKLQEAFCIYRSHKKAFFLSIVDSIWLQILSIIMHYAFLRAVGLDIGLDVVTVFTTITVTITMLPISINGIGIRENVQVSLYAGLLGIPADLVLASTLLGYIPLLFQAAQGAVVMAVGSRR
jgi:conserved hypothetical protein